MKILSIETSCDETAISLIEASGGLESPSFLVLGNSLISQINVHKEYGGVFPMLAKREHAKNLTPILKDVLTQANLFVESTEIKNIDWNEIESLLLKEEGLYTELKKTFEKIKKPDIDVIAVTAGPGLAPALWVGISFAKALGKIWNIPVIPINHMEGHITSTLIGGHSNKNVIFPALALLISGGHTELVEIKNWGDYKIIGETKDDAVGEAFDKVARMLNLPYPGGPEISRLAQEAREGNSEPKAKFPRPMIHSKDLNFSFSGLKTSVLYYIRDHFSKDETTLSENTSDIAREFEDAVIDVLKFKTLEALEQTAAKTLIVAGGVIANKKLKETFLSFEKDNSGLNILIPETKMATDNALMIGTAAYINLCLNPDLIQSEKTITAQGNLKLGH